MNVLLYFPSIISKKMEIKFICLVEASVYTTMNLHLRYASFVKLF